MRFPYSFNIGLATDTGEQIVVLRPEVPLRIHGPQGVAELRALVDTGADNTILPSSVANRLQIDTTPCCGPHATAFGGQQIPLSYADIELELRDADNLLHWTAHIYFADFPEGSEPAVLGHEGFLDFFTATFDGQECVLELNPNTDLPSVSIAESIG